jgi:glutamate 5-kinase
MPGTATRQRIAETARRVVVKVGTNAICDEQGRVNRRVITSLAKQLAEQIHAGRHIVLVASGAIGAGVGELDLPERPKQIPRLQAAAAVGQGQLMRTFHDAFGRHEIPVAQVLLTRADFEDRTRYLNIRNTLRALADFGALPIINENDTVAVDEIRFGDNDVLAALVANMSAADLAVFLTSVDGVIKEGEVLDVIERMDDETRGLATADKSRLGSGGMLSKLEAAGLVMKAGEVAVIANASEPHVLRRLLAGERIGTVFVPARRRMTSRRRWIAQASRASGRLVIDAGAARALSQRGKSLLPSGITAVGGRFVKGSVVSIVDSSGRQIARGLTNYSSQQIEQIMGKRSTQIAKILGDKPYDEVVHRNNLTLA